MNQDLKVSMLFQQELGSRVTVSKTLMCFLLLFYSPFHTVLFEGLREFCRVCCWSPEFLSSDSLPFRARKLSES